MTEPSGVSPSGVSPSGVSKRGRTEFAAALLLQIVGTAGVLVIATREWQTVTLPRRRPLTDLAVPLTGRAVDAAPTAFALVALAGVVAVLATKGIGRRLIGALVALAGAALVWRCSAAIAAVAGDRARELVRDRHRVGALTGTAVPQVTTHPLWGLLSALGGVLVVAAGLGIAVRGGRWAGMSARYETPAAPEDRERERARADASLWIALDRGDDPTRT